MNETKGRKPGVSKLQKGLTAKGGEFFFSKKPSTKKSDHAVAKPAPEKVQKIHVKKER